MDSFSERVDRYVIASRPADGGVWPRNDTVPNPKIPDEVRTRVTKTGDRLWQVCMSAGAATTFAGFVLAVTGWWGFNGNGGFEACDAINALMLLGLLFGMLAGLTANTIVGRVGFGKVPETVWVPLDVAAAYNDYRAACQQLRDGDANPQVIERVEDERAHMDAMVTELARLTAAKQAQTPTGVALRDRVVHIAAQTRVLADMDVERTKLSELAVDTTEADLLLSRPVADLGPVAETITEESSRLREVLATGAADQVIPAALAAGGMETGPA